MKVLVGALLLMSAPAFAAQRIPTEIQVDLKPGLFSASVKEGFHFNEKAPNSISLDGKTIKPKSLSGRTIEFDSLPEKFKSGKAYLFVCDDALTFCEPKTIELGEKSKTSTAPLKSKAGKPNKHGFIEDDYFGALEAAKKQKALLLVDFSARWCPGCMRFESETFGTKTFKDLTAGFVKVKLDVDRFENSVIKEKFKVWGIPTLLVINPEQEEIIRLYDYQPMETLTAFFKDVATDSSTLNQLETKAKSGDSAAAAVLGRRLALAGRNAEAIGFLSKIQPPVPELALAEINQARDDYSKDPTKKSALIKTFKDWLGREPKSSRSIEWRTELVGLLDDKTEIAKIAFDGSALADDLLKDPAALKEAMKTDLIGEFTGIEPLKVALNRAELMMSAESTPELQKQAWLTAAQTAKSLNITAAQTGPAVRYLSILIRAEDLKEADRISQLLMKKDPASTEMQYRRFKVLMAAKKYSEAVDLGLLCLKNSYGRNEFVIAEQLAKAMVAEKRTSEAKALLDKYLARTDMNWPTMQASRKNLETLRGSL